MSRLIYRSNDHNVTVARLFLGANRGVGYEITDDEGRQIRLTENQLDALVRACVVVGIRDTSK